MFKKNGRQRYSNCQLWIPNRGYTRHICIIQDTNCSADDSVRHGQNQEKEKKLRLLNGMLSFPKIFIRRKINIVCSRCSTMVRLRLELLRVIFR